MIATVAATALGARLGSAGRAGTRPKTTGLVPVPVLVLVPAALAVVAAAAALLAVPLPSGRVYGAGADGRPFEFDVLSVRSWGSYVGLAGTALCFSAMVLLVRRGPAAPT